MAIVKYGANEVGTSQVDLFFGKKTWRAFVDTIDPIANALGQSVELLVNDVSFFGTILSGEEDTGRGNYMIVGGSGSLKEKVFPVSLRSDGGILLVTAVSHLFDEINQSALKRGGRQESFEITSGSSTIGNSWAPIADSGANLLDSLAMTWFVNRLGTVVVNGQSSTVVDAGNYATVKRIHSKAIELAPRDPAGVSALFDSIGGTISGDPLVSPRKIASIRMTETDVLRVEVSS